TNFRAALATIFSRNRAPPPPLMRARPGPTSSAPSTAKSSTGNSSNVTMGIESDSASCRLVVEVAMPRTRRPCFTRSPSSSMNILEVLPLQSPTRLNRQLRRVFGHQAGLIFVALLFINLEARHRDHGCVDAGSLQLLRGLHDHRNLRPGGNQNDVLAV